METDEQDKPVCDQETKEPPVTKQQERLTVNGTSPPSRDSPAVNGNADDTDTQDGPILLPDNANDDMYSLFFTNNNWYLFFRLHQLLCQRLYNMYQCAVEIIEEDSRCKQERKESTSIALRLKAPTGVEPEEYYPYFLEMIKGLLDGNLEPNQFEDTLREMFGINAYTAFTMDKLVQNIVRQLQHIVCDEICIQVTQMFHDEKKNGAVGGAVSTGHQRISVETGYQKRAETLLTDENCYKIQMYKNECKITIELLDTEIDNVEEPVEVEKWSDYIDKYIASNETLPTQLRSQLIKKPVFLPRNIRQWRKGSAIPTKLVQSTPAPPVKVKKEPSDSGSDKATPEPPEVDDAANKGVKEEVMNEMKDDEPVIKEENQGEPLADSTPRENGDEKMDIDSGESDGKELEGVDVTENTECKFDVNQFKMVYVVNSESYLHRYMALSKARKSHKKVSLCLHKKFSDWVDKWREKNVNGEQERSCRNWLMGRSEGLRRNMTAIMHNTDLEKTPYYKYNKYTVEYMPELPE